jgi:hypothetical protein
MVLLQKRLCPAEVPDPPSVTLEAAAESLCGLFLREFEKAAKDGNGTKVTRFFKLFPLIGRSDVGLDVYGRYVCQGVSSRARSNLNAGTGGNQRKDSFYANALTKLFEHIAQIVEGPRRSCGAALRCWQDDQSDREASGRSRCPRRNYTGNLGR